MNADAIDNMKTRSTRARAGVNRPVRAAIVGAGLMGRWHAAALSQAGGRVVGFADFDLTRAETLAAKFSGARAFLNLETMLGAQAPDVLHVCSPTESHEALAAQATAAGVHLLIEKPLAPDAATTAEIYERAAGRGTLVCPVHQFPFQDGARRARENLAAIGRLVHVEAQVCSAGGAGAQAAALDRLALDILPHPLAMLQKLLGVDPSALEWRARNPARGEWRIESETGAASVAIMLSLNARPTVNAFRLYGSEGTLHLDLFHGFSFVEPGGASRAKKILRPFDLARRQLTTAGLNLARRALRREPAYPGLRRLIAEFYAAVRHGGAPPISKEEAVAVAAVRDRLLRIESN